MGGLLTGEEVPPDPVLAWWLITVNRLSVVLMHGMAGPRMYESL